VGAAHTELLTNRIEEVSAVGRPHNERSESWAGLATQRSAATPQPRCAQVWCACPRTAHTPNEARCAAAARGRPDTPADCARQLQLDAHMRVTGTTRVRCGAATPVPSVWTCSAAYVPEPDSTGTVGAAWQGLRDGRSKGRPATATGFVSIPQGLM